MEFGRAHRDDPIATLSRSTGCDGRVQLAVASQRIHYVPKRTGGSEIRDSRVLSGWERFFVNVADRRFMCR